MHTKMRIERLERNSQEIQCLPLYAAEYNPATDSWTASNGKAFRTEQAAIAESMKQPILPLYQCNPYSD